MWTVVLYAALACGRVRPVTTFLAATAAVIID